MKTPQKNRLQKNTQQNNNTYETNIKSALQTQYQKKTGEMNKQKEKYENAKEKLMEFKLPTEKSRKRKRNNTSHDKRSC